MYIMGECTPEDDAHQDYAINVYFHHLHTVRTSCHHLRQKSAIPLTSRLIHDTREAMLGRVVV